jgi:hypothetical protein
MPPALTKRSPGGWIYDGDFAKAPGSFKCPVCKSPKSRFKVYKGKVSAATAAGMRGPASTGPACGHRRAWEQQQLSGFACTGLATAQPACMGPPPLPRMAASCVRRAAPPPACAVQRLLCACSPRPMWPLPSLTAPIQGRRQAQQHRRRAQAALPGAPVVRARPRCAGGLAKRRPGAAQPAPARGWPPCPLDAAMRGAAGAAGAGADAGTRGGRAAAQRSAAVGAIWPGRGDGRRGAGAQACARLFGAAGTAGPSSTACTDHLVNPKPNRAIRSTTVTGVQGTGWFDYGLHKHASWA